MLTIDDNNVGEIECMFEQGIYFYVLYCLCYFNDILTEMLEDQQREEEYPGLDLEDNFISLDYRENNWKDDIVDSNEDKKKFHTFRWYVFMK